MAELDRRDAFDLVTAFDAIHDQAKPRTVLWGEQKTIEYLADAGFQDVTVRKPEDDWINSFYTCAKQ